MERCNRADCTLCKIDKEGCQCKAREAGCWFCAPNKFQRPSCESVEQEFREWKAKLVREIDAKIASVCAEYDLDELPDYIYAKQDSIMATQTREEAERIFNKMMRWSIIDAGIATGHSRQNRISEKAAKRADSLAKLLEEKGDQKGAERQKRRAAEIRTQVQRQATEE